MSQPIDFAENARRYATVYQAQDEAVKCRYQKIDRLEKKLAKLKASHPNCISWIDALIQPIADALAERYPALRFEILGPFGRGATVAIHAEPKTTPAGIFGVIGSLQFRPVDLSKGEICLVETETDTGEYRYGTMGEMNGFNHPTVPLPSFEELCQRLDKQFQQEVAA